MIILTRPSSGTADPTAKQVLSAGLVLDTAPGNDTINGVSSHLLIKPSDAHPNANGITIKRPSHSAGGWGNKNAPYGSSQPIELLSDSATDASLSADVTNPVLFRLDSFGGVGICHGIHCATGMREQADATPPTQGIWIDPSIDAIGMIMDNPQTSEVASQPTSDYLLIRDVRPATAYSLVQVVADGTIKSNKALVATARTATDIPLKVQALAAQTANVAEIYDNATKKRITITPADGGLRGIADDGTTAAFTLTPLNSGTVGYRAIIAAVVTSTHALCTTSPAGMTADHYQAVPSGGVKFRINKAGYPMGRQNAAPALADMVDGEWALWLDTAGNAFKIAARIGGVLKTGTVAVA